MEFWELRETEGRWVGAGVIIAGSVIVSILLAIPFARGISE